MFVPFIPTPSSPTEVVPSNVAADISDPTMLSPNPWIQYQISGTGTAKPPKNSHGTFSDYRLLRWDIRKYRPSQNTEPNKVRRYYLTISTIPRVTQNPRSILTQWRQTEKRREPHHRVSLNKPTIPRMMEQNHLRIKRPIRSGNPSMGKICSRIFPSLAQICGLAGLRR
jgi:hypothetical protein